MTNCVDNVVLVLELVAICCCYVYGDCGDQLAPRDVKVVCG